MLTSRNFGDQHFQVISLDLAFLSLIVGAHCVNLCQKEFLYTQRGALQWRVSMIGSILAILTIYWPYWPLLVLASFWRISFRATCYSPWESSESPRPSESLSSLKFQVLCRFIQNVHYWAAKLYCFGRLLSGKTSRRTPGRTSRSCKQFV